MNYFQKLDFEPIPGLFDSLSELITSNTISYGEYDHQICINTTKDHPDDYTLGRGSLVYDWNKSEEYIDDDGITRVRVPNKEHIYEESDFNTICSQFVGTPFERLYNILDENYILGRVRIMRLSPKACMSWHTDSSPRVHYSVSTQKGCYMVIKDEINHMEADTWWWTNTVEEHTAFNGSNADRIHIVAVILGEK